MGVRGAKEGRVQHPRQLQVADEARPPLHQPAQVRARHGPANVAVGPVQRRQAAHDCPARAAATASTASTMDW